MAQPLTAGFPRSQEKFGKRVINYRHIPNTFCFARPLRFFKKGHPALDTLNSFYRWASFNTVPSQHLFFRTWRSNIMIRLATSSFSKTILNNQKFILPKTASSVLDQIPFSSQKIIKTGAKKLFLLAPTLCSSFSSSVGKTFWPSRQSCSFSIGANFLNMFYVEDLMLLYMIRFFLQSFVSSSCEPSKESLKDVSLPNNKLSLF